MNTTDNYGVAPQNYLTLAIIATLLGCCSTWGLGFIAGIIAIYFASQVNPRFNAGDLAGAEKNSKYAKILSFVAIGLMVVNLAYTAYIFTSNPDFFQEQMEQYEILMEQYEAQNAE